jgi:ferredoxin--NADP+ reductase
MTYVITQSCCNDAECVELCPADAIHPAPGSPAYETAEQLYIDPGSCIECDACMDVCPVEAIYPDQDLPQRLLPYISINADYFARA